MKEISDLHYRVVDKGLFLPVAQRLARQARKVSYWTPCDKDFPTAQDRLGDGFPGIERVDCWLHNREDVDCWVFPDVGFAGLQSLLADSKEPVWGSMGGCEIETERGLFLEILKNAGLNVPPNKEIIGAQPLRELLYQSEDRYVKMSHYRGDWETLHWRSRAEDGDELEARLLRFGPYQDTAVFYVFEPIPGDIEDGCDAYVIEGEIPSLVIHGMEAKDKAFIASFQPFEEFPQKIRHVTETFAPVLGDYGYRGFFSTEVRVTDDGEIFFIDPTCRCGSPPSQVQSEMIGNYAEVIWAGANGECIDPEPAAKFGVQALCKFKRDPNTWTYVKVDDELGRWLKSTHCMFHNDRLCLPPGEYVTGCEDWLVGIGDTIEEAIKHLQHNIKLLPEGSDCDETQLCELLEEVQEAEAQGMEFTDEPVPPPESVIDKHD